MAIGIVQVVENTEIHEQMSFDNSSPRWPHLRGMTAKHGTKTSSYPRTRIVYWYALGGPDVSRTRQES